MQLVPRKKQQTSNVISLRDAMNRMFDDAFWDPFHMFGRDSLFPSVWHDTSVMQFIPSTDIYETDKEVTVVVDVPGYDPDKIDVRVQDGVLTLQGTMQEEKEEKDEKKKWYRKECSGGSFYRQFTLPDYAEDDKTTCAFKNGKLTVTIPKKPDAAESQSGRKIPIDIG